MKKNICWGRVSSSFLGVGLALFLYQPSLAESVKDLESRILQGSDPSADAAEQNSQAEAEVPDFKEADKEIVNKQDLQAIEDAVKGPSEIPQSHIMVVQRRYIRKEGRHEFVPAMVGFQPADSFRRQIQFGFGYVYHVTESFGVELLHANVVRNFNTGLALAIRDATPENLETDRIEPVLTFGASLQWTPLRSKAGADTSINYFEGFFLGGGGMSRYEDQNASMLMAGLGFRIYLTKFAIFKTEIRDYVDFKSGGTDYRLNILAGIGVLLGSGQ